MNTVSEEEIPSSGETTEPDQPQQAQGQAAINQLVETFCQTYPFPLDSFQYTAIRVLAAGSSVLVAAPTGTGKTVVAEFAIWLALREGQRVFYTAPVKALSNQKFRDFRERYGSESVGLMTGDIVENPTAPIVVMTTEIYRNVLLELERDDRTVAATEFAGSVAATELPNGRQLDAQLSHIGYVIFDELHYMADPQRGPVWEECIIHSPSHVRFVGLSATVHNANELVNWMTQVHAPTKLVFHPERAIPLEDYFYYKEVLTLVRDAQGKRVKRFPHVGGENKRRSYRSRQYEPADDAVVLVKPQAPSPTEVLGVLAKAELLPCLYFLPGRKTVEEAAQSCVQMTLTTPAEQAHVKQEVDQWFDQLIPEDRTLEQSVQLARLLPLGIGYHHAGLLPTLKVLVESIFAQGMLRAVFATDTLALGVNMPARSVVLGSLSKFDGVGMRLMTPNEYQQLTGRAGRRGMDARGAAILLYSPWEEFEPSFQALTKELLPVISAFSMRYNSVLNLWRPNSFERLRRIGAASFLEYQRRTRRAKRGKKGKKVGRVERERLQPTAPLQSSEPILDDDHNVELGGSVEHELLATATVLRIFGYISSDDDTLTLQGRLLRAIFHPAGLTITELMLSGSLDDLTSDELAEAISWFVYDSDKPLWSQNKLSDRLKLVRRATHAMSEKVRKMEIRHELPPSTNINENFMGVALGWAQGLTLAGLRQRISLAEGDLLMTLNQTIDLLRQLESACQQILEDVDLWGSHSSLVWLDRRELRQRLSYLKSSFRLASRQLLHGTVAQSRSLPFRAAGLPTPDVEAEGEAVPANDATAIFDAVPPEVPDSPRVE